MRPRLERPELICFGLQLGTMMKFLNNAVQELKRKGPSPTPHLHQPDLRRTRRASFANTSGRLRIISASSQGNFGCLQEWSDKNGHFPMDAVCNAEVRRIQTPINPGYSDKG